MSQPRWDPDERRWLLDEDDEPGPRHRGRSIDVGERSGVGVRERETRTGRAPSPVADPTRTGFDEDHHPRPGSRDRDDRGSRVPRPFHEPDLPDPRRPSADGAGRRWADGDGFPDPPARHDGGLSGGRRHGGSPDGTARHEEPDAGGRRSRHGAEGRFPAGRYDEPGIAGFGADGSGPDGSGADGFGTEGFRADGSGVRGFGPGGAGSGGLPVGGFDVGHAGIAGRRAPEPRAGDPWRDLPDPGRYPDRDDRFDAVLDGADRYAPRDLPRNGSTRHDGSARDDGSVRDDGAAVHDAVGWGGHGVRGETSRYDAAGPAVAGYGPWGPDRPRATLGDTDVQEPVGHRGRDGYDAGGLAALYAGRDHDRAAGYDPGYDRLTEYDPLAGYERGGPAVGYHRNGAPDAGAGFGGPDLRPDADDHGPDGHGVDAYDLEGDDLGDLGPEDDPAGPLGPAGPVVFDEVRRGVPRRDSAPGGGRAARRRARYDDAGPDGARAGDESGRFAGAWYDAARSGEARSGEARSGEARSEGFRLGEVRPGDARYERDRDEDARFGNARYGGARDEGSTFEDSRRGMAHVDDDQDNATRFEDAGFDGAGFDGDGFEDDGFDDARAAGPRGADFRNAERRNDGPRSGSLQGGDLRDGDRRGGDLRDDGPRPAPDRHEGARHGATRDDDGYADWYGDGGPEGAPYDDRYDEDRFGDDQFDDDHYDDRLGDDRLGDDRLADDRHPGARFEQARFEDDDDRDRTRQFGMTAPDESPGTPEPPDAADAADAEAADQGTGAGRTRRTRRRWPWVLGGIVVLGGLAVPVVAGLQNGAQDQQVSGSVDTTGYGSGAGAAAPQPSPDASAPQQAPAGEVTFQVTGSGTANTITYSRGSSISQASGVPLPWEQKVPGAPGGSDYAITAQTSGEAQEISCTITVDGVVIAEQKAKGSYAAVSCVGRR